MNNLGKIIRFNLLNLNSKIFFSYLGILLFLAPIFFVLSSIKKHNRHAIVLALISFSLPLFSQTDSTSNSSIDQVISIVDKVEETNNFIDQLIPDSNVTLPLGIIKQIGAARYIIAVDSMKFGADAAYFSAYAAIDLPGSTKKLAFRGSHIMFNPSGVIGGRNNWNGVNKDSIKQLPPKNTPLP